jgi:hypothetical protein
MIVGYCPHTKGYRVRLRDRVVVTPHVHFVEEESGAATLSLPMEPVPKELGTRPARRETFRDVMIYRDEVMESESSDIEEDHHSPLIISPGPVSPAHGEVPADSTVTQHPHGPDQDAAHQDLTHMMAKLQLAARDGGAATSNISGIRTRAQATVRHRNGAPVPTAMDQPKTRAQRLEQRNARKETLQNGEVAEAGNSCGSSGEMEVSAQVVGKSGEAMVTKCTDCEEPGEVIDIVESARCVLHEVMADCIYGSDSEEDEVLTNDKYVSPRTRFGQVQCDSRSEIILKNRFASLQPEEVVSTQDEEEVVVPGVFRGTAPRKQVKGGIKTPVGAEKDIEEIVREIEEEAPMSASMAFMRACLASPAGVRMSKVPVPNNYREARESEQWPFWEQAMVEEKNS